MELVIEILKIMFISAIAGGIAGAVVVLVAGGRWGNGVAENLYIKQYRKDLKKIFDDLDGNGR